jgi:hypothetical protein
MWAQRNELVSVDVPDDVLISIDLTDVKRRSLDACFLNRVQLFIIAFLLQSNNDENCSLPGYI